MNENVVRQVASLITEDPNILPESSAVSTGELLFREHIVNESRIHDKLIEILQRAKQGQAAPEEIEQVIQFITSKSSRAGRIFIPPKN